MNILFDVIETQNKLLSDLPFNDVDSLVFATLAYCDFSQILTNTPLCFCDIDVQKIKAPKSANERYQNHYQLLKHVAESKRYAQFAISDFVNIFCNQSDKQFSAVTFVYDKFVYVAFRGTDATLVGWKEDANLSFMQSIPAQQEALLYLEKIAKKYKRKIILIGGHSKGGNLAIYASSKCRWLVQRRIKAVFCHDGPGFLKDFFETKGYKRISGRIQKTVPPSSIIGMLLENPTHYQVIESQGKSIFQHNPYFWKVVDHQFVQLEEMDAGWIEFNQQLNEWLNTISLQKRKEFVTLLFDFFETAEITDFSSGKEMLWLAFKHRKVLTEKYKNLDDETKDFFSRTLKEIFAFVRNSRKVDKKTK